MVENKLLRRSAIILVFLLIILLTGKILFSIQNSISVIINLLTPFLMAIIVAYILDPVIDWMEKFKISRILSILLLMLFIIIVIAVLVFIVLPTLIKEISGVVSNIPDFFERVINFLNRKTNLSIGKETASLVRENLNIIKIKSYIPEAANIISNVTGEIYNQFKNIFNVIVSFGLFLIASFYFLKDFDKIKMSLISMFPAKYKTTWIELLKNIDKLLKSFFRGQLIVCTILATLNVIGLSIIGLKFAFLIGVAAGYFNIVPYLGVTLGIIVSLIISYIQYGSFIHLIYVLIVYGVVQSLDGIFITPNILGDKTGLAPIIIIFSLLLFGTVFGFFGVLLAVPLACICKVLLQFFIKKYKSSDFFN